MTKIPESLESVDWSLTTWDGSRKDQLRRWAELPFERVLAAQEEMEELAQMLGTQSASPSPRAGVDLKQRPLA